MKGYRFFANMPEARGSKSASKANPFFPWTVKVLQERAATGFRCDVLAMCLDDRGNPEWNNDSTFGTVSTAIEGNPYSYCYGSASPEYVRKRCTRIPEALARQLSPEIFTYLES